MFQFEKDTAPHFQLLILRWGTLQFIRKNKLNLYCLFKDDVKSFVIPTCPRCGGFVKPDVVFFGENVPTDRVERVKYEVTQCSSVLVLGSSLSTFSAFRIILQAVEARKPICIVNIGETRADSLANDRIEARCGDILTAAFS